MSSRRPVPGYEGLYEVSDDGHVYTVEHYTIASNGKRMPTRAHRLAERSSNAGYLRVCLRQNGHAKMCSVHRLVASAFIPNPEGKREVNHLNCDRHDNRVENLEWVTPKENVAYSFTHGLRRYQLKPVLVDGELWFPSIAAAAKWIGTDPATICGVLSDRNHTVHGHTVQYDKGGQSARRAVAGSAIE